MIGLTVEEVRRVGDALANGLMAANPPTEQRAALIAFGELLRDAAVSLDAHGEQADQVIVSQLADQFEALATEEE